MRDRARVVGKLRRRCRPAIIALLWWPLALALTAGACSLPSNLNPGPWLRSARTTIEQFLGTPTPALRVKLAPTDGPRTPTPTLRPPYRPTATATIPPTEGPSPTPAAQQSAAVVALSNANLRSGPGTHYGVVGGVKQGDVMEIRGCKEPEGWCQLADGRWIARSLITAALDEQASAPGRAAPAATGTPPHLIPPSPTTTPAPLPTLAPTATAAPAVAVATPAPAGEDDALLVWVTTQTPPPDGDGRELLAPVAFYLPMPLRLSPLIAAPPTAAAPRVYLPGMTEAGVVAYWQRDYPLKCDEPLSAEGRTTWRCRLTSDDGSAQVNISIEGDAASKLTNITVMALTASAGGAQTAADWLRFAAMLPYYGADPDSAARWMGAQGENAGSLTIGGVKFTLYGPGATRTLELAPAQAAP